LTKTREDKAAAVRSWRERNKDRVKDTRAAYRAANKDRQREPRKVKPYIDITGQRFGRLTALEPSAPDSSGVFKWLCACDCGNRAAIRSTNLRSGNTRSCGCLPNPRKLLGDEAKVRLRFRQYRKEAPKRGRSFDLSFDLFAELVRGACEYCGAREGINGIDRQDNALGYVEGNCVPCCKTCNFLKRDMPLDKWIDWLRRIAVHHASRGVQ